MHLDWPMLISTILKTQDGPVNQGRNKGGGLEGLSPTGLPLPSSSRIFISVNSEYNARFTDMYTLYIHTYNQSNAMKVCTLYIFFGDDQMTQT